jgi:hypothetical protein
MVFLCAALSTVERSGLAGPTVVGFILVGVLELADGRKESRVFNRIQQLFWRMEKTTYYGQVAELSRARKCRFYVTVK